MEIIPPANQHAVVETISTMTSASLGSKHTSIAHVT